MATKVTCCESDSINEMESQESISEIFKQILVCESGFNASLNIQVHYSCINIKHTIPVFTRLWLCINISAKQAP